MQNDYFNFRQFTVQQRRSAMKVTTDACAFGAWAASSIKNKNIPNVLDIGTGTGLLSLMIAQQVNASIDAIELDENTFEEAKENFSSSPWKGRMRAIHGDALTYNF